jgi:glycosyltransferase involved in cell wall biosynthesis
MPMEVAVLEFNGRGTPIIDDLAKYFQSCGVKVFSVGHPLSRNDSRSTLFTSDGDLRLEAPWWIPNCPPFTYVFDLVWPIHYPRYVDFWIGFTNIAVLKGLALRRIGRVSKCVYYAIDYSPNRFGRFSILTVLYRTIDRFVARRVDLRVDLSQSQQHARNSDLHLKLDSNQIVIPVGLWSSEFRLAPDDKGSQDKRLAYFGSLSTAQGAQYLPQILKELHTRGLTVRLEIIGDGPLRKQLEIEFEVLNLTPSVVFHGYLEDRQEALDIISACWLGLAPYSREVVTFTSTTDSGKFKAYLEAGVPFISTEVSTSAGEMESRGCALVVRDWTGFADAIESLISDHQLWLSCRENVVKARSEFEWPILFDRLYSRLCEV